MNFLFYIFNILPFLRIFTCSKYKGGRRLFRMKLVQNQLAC